MFLPYIQKESVQNQYKYGKKDSHSFSIHITYWVSTCTYNKLLVESPECTPLDLKTSYRITYGIKRKRGLTQTESSRSSEILAIWTMSFCVEYFPWGKQNLREIPMPSCFHVICHSKQYGKKIPRFDIKDSKSLAQGNLALHYSLDNQQNWKSKRMLKKPE